VLEDFMPTKTDLSTGSNHSPRSTLPQKSSSGSSATPPDFNVVSNDAGFSTEPMSESSAYPGYGSPQNQLVWYTQMTMPFQGSTPQQAFVPPYLPVTKDYFVGQQSFMPQNYFAQEQSLLPQQYHVQRKTTMSPQILIPPHTDMFQAIQQPIMSSVGPFMAQGMAFYQPMLYGIQGCDLTPYQPTEQFQWSQAFSQTSDNIFGHQNLQPQTTTDSCQHPQPHINLEMAPSHDMAFWSSTCFDGVGFNGSGFNEANFNEPDLQVANPENAL
jgi:hypothetical protein